MKYCVYRTSHPDGRWYVGRSDTASVKSGKYQGSGTRIKRALKKYPGEFVTEVLHEGLTTEEADAIEASLVTQHVIDTDPLCLNLVPGGKHPGWATQQEARATTIQRISATRKERMKDPAFRAIYAESCRKANAKKQENMMKKQYTLSTDTQDLTFSDKNAFETYVKQHKLEVFATSPKTYVVSGDRMFTLEGVKFRTVAEMRAVAKEKRAKLVKLGNREYALLSRILHICGECGWAHRGKRDMVSHWRAEHKDTNPTQHLETPYGTKQTTWRKGEKKYARKA